MKTIGQALIDEVHIPISFGYIENVCIKRGLDPEEEFSRDIADCDLYKGALADCLYSLVQAVGFSESDKSIGSLTEDQRKAIIFNVNKLYRSIGEEEVYLESQPTVYINC